MRRGMGNALRREGTSSVFAFGKSTFPKGEGLIPDAPPACFAHWARQTPVPKGKAYSVFAKFSFCGRRFPKGERKALWRGYGAAPHLPTDDCNRSLKVI